MDTSWILSNTGRISHLAFEHAMLAWPPLLFTAILALPLGWCAFKYPKAREVIITLTGLLYIIPSLALFIVLPLALGTPVLSPINVMVAMTLFGLALQVRFCADSFATVPPVVSAAASAMGYSGWQRFLKVELPLAGPGVIAGLRVVSASTISLISVGALIGVPSLGTLFTEGFQRNFPTQVIVGLLLSVAMALVFDLFLVLCKHALMPWVRRI